MDFNNELHKELFALFILESNGLPVGLFAFAPLHTAESFYSLMWHDRSHAPESFERWVSDRELNSYKNPSIMECMIRSDREVFNNKITIQVVRE